MAKLILISDEDLKSLMHQAATEAVDNLAKKIASRCAIRSYNNQIFRESRREDGYLSCGAGDNGGGCGGNYDYSYGGCGSGAGCGSSSRSSGGCGSSGGC